LLPKNLHQAAFSLRAFNIEIAAVKDQITDSKIGLMRLQFWTDAINAIYAGGNVPNHPVVLELQVHSSNSVFKTKD
jgi:NADH dehydrogenase [ubiquinone] 1 alpha subcomplex assembly factor 6